MTYPKWKHHPSKPAVTVYSEDEEKSSLGDGWFDNPGDFGVETAPGATPDPEIAKNAAAQPAPPPDPVVALQERVAALETTVADLVSKVYGADTGDKGDGDAA